MASALGDLIAGTTGCVGCWDFEETAGTSAEDISANTNTGTYSGAARIGVQGANGKGFLSLANGDFVTVADHATLDVADTFTLVAVARRDLVHSSNACTLMSKGTGAYNFSIVANKLRLLKNGGAVAMLATPTIVDLHREHLFVCRKNAGTEMSLWIDGVNVALDTNSNQTFIDTTTAISIGGGGSSNFGGLVGLAACFNVAVTDQTIAAWAAAWTDKIPASVMAVSANRRYGVHHDMTYFGDSTANVETPLVRGKTRSRVSRHSGLPHVIRAGAVDPGADDWTAHDRAFNLARAQGMEVIVAWHGSPEWLNGSADRTVVPGTGGTATDPTGDAAYTAWRDDWLEIVERAVLRYPWIRKWECWNEPNLTDFWAQGGTPAPSARYYADLYLNFRTVVLAANPNAQVYLGALGSVGAAGAGDVTGVTMPATTGFLNQLTNSYGINDANCDILTVHPYENGAGTGDPLVYTENQNNFQDAWRAYDWLRYKGISAELGITEHGRSSATVSEVDQASYYSNALAMVRDYMPFVGPVCHFLAVDTVGFPGWGLFTTAYAEKQATAVVRDFHGAYDRRQALDLDGPGLRVWQP